MFKPNRFVSIPPHGSRTPNRRHRSNPNRRRTITRNCPTAPTLGSLGKSCSKNCPSSNNSGKKNRTWTSNNWKSRCVGCCGSFK